MNARRLGGREGGREGAWSRREDRAGIEVMHYKLTRSTVIIPDTTAAAQTDGVTSAHDTLLSTIDAIRDAIAIRHCQAFRFAEAHRYAPVCIMPIIIILRPIGTTSIGRMLGPLRNGDRHMKKEHQEGESYFHSSQCTAARGRSASQPVTRARRSAAGDLCVITARWRPV